jgi:hypothetical protein
MSEATAAAGYPVASIAALARGQSGLCASAQLVERALAAHGARPR